MPTVLREGPYRFFFFSNESQEPPHIHVKSDQKVAKYWLSPIELAANRGFRKHELNEIEEIVQDHLWAFLEAWNEHFNQEEEG
jgi:hypothetical protein